MQILITPGAGGPDAVAFAATLTDIYRRWAARHGATITDIPGGLEVTGECPFHNEPGSHKWVGISAHRGGKRATAYVSVAIDGNDARGEWGAHRSYVFTPYRLVTAYPADDGEPIRADLDAVLAGDLTAFYPKE